MTTHHENDLRIQRTYGLRYAPSRFLSLDLALQSCRNQSKASAVVMGDDSRFWVVCLADATRCERMGLEVA